MKLFTADKIRELDQYTIQHEPIASIDLMERAADALFEVILSMYPVTERSFAFLQDRAIMAEMPWHLHVKCNCCLMRCKSICLVQIIFLKIA